MTWMMTPANTQGQLPWDSVCTRLLTLVNRVTISKVKPRNNMISTIWRRFFLEIVLFMIALSFFGVAAVDYGFSGGITI